MSEQSLTISVQEAADMLGIGLTLAYEMARAGALPVLRCGRLMRVSRSALEEMIAHPPAPPVPAPGKPGMTLWRRAQRAPTAGGPEAMAARVRKAAEERHAARLAAKRVRA